ncbi:hypothetical protein HanXRQr2_Chr05g0204861 [Helianthus annuus]|uniref:Uncharacterized protein n=1 Tax=Helianthus annuus TaxID=4232 RepID=A0A9K3IYH1_HELAN|nr:hypothetical protein HanXRQr2_Chr05g0204861 [Helianthus annuus]KAJ0569604.1 hypothetical protein HanHA300_Chr05g0168161 [Helianthus annuus]KAJ0583915.1 hypothetical protein HanHA89_Chr05g0182221 [Helianthus annuus]KAJ0921938.1 hypothetical protein HanPSC8_Chr05g0197611 [Helianthus annuus]
MYASPIKGLNNYKIVHALKENPVVYEDLILEFWKTTKFEALGGEGNGSIEVVVQKKNIVVTEQMIREVLLFGDKETDPINHSPEVIEALLPRLTYEGTYPPLLKKFVHPYWRLLMHMFIICMTENREGTDQLNITQYAAFISLITNQDYNYSKYVFEGMKRNITGVQKDKFMMYPRFLQIILNARYLDLAKSGNTLELKPMGPTCFGALAPKKKSFDQFQGKTPLEKFGQIPKTEEVVAEPVNAPVNAEFVVEHNVQMVNVEEPETEFQNLDSDDEGVMISYDGDDELPSEDEVDSTVLAAPLVITSENLALLLN